MENKLFGQKMKTLLLATLVLLGALPIAGAPPSVDALETRVKELEKELAVFKARLEARETQVLRTGPTPPRGESEIIINILADGSFSVMEKTFQGEELKERLRAIKEVSPNQVLRLCAPGTATFRTILQAVELCQSAGLWNIAFATKSENTESSPRD